MSQADVERFVSDLKSNDELRAELSGHASGVGSVVEFAKDKGYDLSAEEVSSYIQGQAGSDLSDAQLDAIAGGKGHHSSSVSETQVATAQTVAMATTEAVAAETTINVGAEVEVVAVAAVVLT